MDEMKTEKDCIFCKIVKNEIPSWTIYEDKYVKAFLDISQTSRGHTLVIPKKHYKNIFDIPKELLEKIIDASQKVAILLRNNMGAQGINLLNANNKIAQQEIFHYHMHVIPRYPRKKFKIVLSNPTSDKDFERIKKEILGR